MFKFQKRLSVLFALVFVLCLLGTASGVEKPIKVGVPASLTGPYASDGLVAKQGVILAVEDINSRGGLLGRPIEIYYYDVEDVMPEKVMASAEYLCMGEQVNFIMTSWVDYGVDVKAYGRYDVPFFEGATSSLSIVAYQENPELYWNWFEYNPTEEEYSRQGWEAMMQLPYEYPNKKVFIINEDDHWSHVIADEFEMLAKKDGWEIVGHEIVTIGTTEWEGILTKIRATDPAIIQSVSLCPPGIASFMRQFQKDPTDSLIFMPYIACAAEFKQLGGEYANGVFWDMLMCILPGSERDAFREKFSKRFGAEYWREGFPAAIWDMMHFWEDAVNAVGDVEDYRAICKYFEETTYEGLCGPYAFAKETHTTISGVDFLPPGFYQVKDGEDVCIWPDVRVTGEFFVPRWIEKE